MNKKRKPLANVCFYLCLAVVMIAMLFPVIWLILSTLKPNEEIFSSQLHFFPVNPTLDAYVYAFNDQNKLLFYLSNSLIIAALTSVITMFFASTGGYAIGRKHFWGVNAIIVFLMIAQMFQGPVIMIPWYKMASNLHLLNTKIGLVCIYLTGTIPMGVWMMSGFYKGIAVELEEAASIDGCNRLRAFWSIILPLAKGGLVAITIYSFILAWNDYQYALILSSSDQSKTVQLIIGELIGSIGVINWGGIMAMGVIVTIPVVILFALVQKWLIEGLTSGAVKG